VVIKMGRTRTRPARTKASSSGRLLPEAFGRIKENDAVLDDEPDHQIKPMNEETLSGVPVSFKHGKDADQ